MIRKLFSSKRYECDLYEIGGFSCFLTTDPFRMNEWKETCHGEKIDISNKRVKKLLGGED